MKKAILILIIVFLTSGICSCRSVKKDISKTEEKTETELVDNSSEKINENLNVKINIEKSENKIEGTVTEKKTVEPVDSSKPSSYTDDNGKKREFNNTKETTEKTTKNSQVQLKENNLSESDLNKISDKKADIKASAKAKKENSELKVNKELFNYWQLLWLLIPIVIIWIIYKKYKDKFWFI